MLTDIAVDNNTILIMRIILAALMGGLIGLERDMHGRAAGLRTHLLVSMGAAVFMILSGIIATSSQAIRGNLMIASDPGRIAAQIVTGIGFLGAGTIIKEGLTVRGLTTAACLWIVAAIGMACGAGCYTIAVATTIISLIGLTVFHYFEQVYPKYTYRILTVVTSINIAPNQIIEVVKRDKLNINYLETERNYKDNTLTVKLYIHLFRKGLGHALSQEIVASLEKAEIPLINISWQHQ
ncbi:MAG: hypothetical protein A2511_02700 [Deltaproteobacteria bacterium RIFOXYD12_FULL_50_9]|nr:MAG: hypothetical protein A2511_02700 [Deltaproteobacteria bacterium RIFOXYD12_FULL_50_9]